MTTYRPHRPFTCTTTSTGTAHLPAKQAGPALSSPTTSRWSSRPFPRVRWGRRSICRRWPWLSTTLGQTRCSGGYSRSAKRAMRIGVMSCHRYRRLSKTCLGNRPVLPQVAIGDGHLERTGRSTPSRRPLLRVPLRILHSTQRALRCGPLVRPIPRADECPTMESSPHTHPRTDIRTSSAIDQGLVGRLRSTFPSHMPHHAPPPPSVYPRTSHRLTRHPSLAPFRSLPLVSPTQVAAPSAWNMQRLNMHQEELFFLHLWLILLNLRFLPTKEHKIHQPVVIHSRNGARTALPDRFHMTLALRHDILSNNTLFDVWTNLLSCMCYDFHDATSIPLR
jgi:hypothetical protein